MNRSFHTKPLKSIGQYKIIDLIQQNDRHSVYRCKFENRSVILKTLGPGKIHFRERRSLIQEGQVLNLLTRVEGIESLVEIDDKHAKPVLILEDAGPITLEDHLRTRSLPLDEFFPLAISLSEILKELHAFRIIHRDLSPFNIVLNQKNKPTLVDFETASTTSSLRYFEISQMLNSSLPYMAPELTGRTHQSIDQRSDLYSLGTIYYQILTGKPPFGGDDPLEYVRAHLAMTPVFPSLIDPSIPRILSQIVTKLLSKMSIDRYQSAEALEYDLNEAYLRWKKSKEIPSFELARLDLDRILPFSKKLYGRESQLNQVENYIKNSVRDSGGLVLIEGLPGVGKSAILDETIRKLQTFEVIYGKCDEIRSHVPYSALLVAFQEFFQTILRSRQDEISQWKEELKKALGLNAILLVDSIPALKDLLGPQNPIPKLDLVETEARFFSTVQNLVKGVLAQGRPFVVILDDLQWADPGLLRFISMTLSDPEISHFCILGTYRSNEVQLNHPIFQLISTVQDKRVRIYRMELGPLSVNQISHFLSELLEISLSQVEVFSELILKKTGGNPFFIRRFLRYLQKRRLLFFDPVANRWAWDSQKLKDVEISENVIDLMIQTLSRLPRSTQKILEVLSCIGRSSDIHLLSSIYFQSPEKSQQLEVLLWPAMEEDLIYTPQLLRNEKSVSTESDLCFQFTHDRVREAVYTRLSDHEKSEIHFCIADHLNSTLSLKDKEARIFEIADQYCLGSSQTLKTNRMEIAQLEVHAGHKARLIAAFEPALRYFSQAIDLFSEISWIEEPDLTFRLYRDAAECAIMLGKSQLGHQWIHIALSIVTSNAKKIELLRLLAIEKNIQGKSIEALQVGREALSLIQVELPESQFELKLNELFSELNSAWLNDSLTELVKKDECNDSDIIAGLELLAGIIPAAYLGNTVLWRIVNLYIVLLSIQYGPTVSSASGCAALAAYLVNQGDYLRGFILGQISMELARRFKDPAKESEVLSIHAAVIHHWRAPLRETAALYRIGINLAMSAGNVQWSTYMISNRIAFLYTLGTPLDQLLNETDSAITHVRNTGNKPMKRNLFSYRQLARCLLGKTRNRFSLDDQTPDSDTLVDPEKWDAASRAVSATAQLQLYYLFGDLRNALEQAQSGGSWIETIKGFFPEIEYRFFYALTLAGIGEVSRARDLENRLIIWSKNSPSNFVHKRLIVSAEIARAERNFPLAQKYFEEAIQIASREGFIHDESLANELCGRLYESLGIHRVALFYLQNARERYLRWGAITKVQALDEEFPEITKTEAQKALAAKDQTRQNIEFLGMLKSFEAFSSELVLGRLLERLLEVSLLIVSAQRGALILIEEGELWIRALGSNSNPIALETSPLKKSDQVSQTIVESVVRTKESVILGDAVRNGPFSEDPYISKGQIKSVLAMPISHQSRTIGVLYFENNLVPYAFTPSRVEALNLLSTQIAVSIENSSLFEKLSLEVEVRTRAEASMRFLAESSRAMAESLDYTETLARVTHLAIPFLGDGCLVQQMTPRRNLKIITSAHNDPRHKKIFDEISDRYPFTMDSPATSVKAIQTGEVSLLSSVTDDLARSLSQNDQHTQLINALNIRSVVSIPLIVRGKIHGALTLYSSIPGRYAQSDIPLIREFGTRCAIAIENAELYSEAQKSIQVRDDFIAIASHELRTPLTPLDMQIQFIKRQLQMGLSDPTKIPQLIKMILSIERQSKRLSNLVEDLLDVSRIIANRLMLEPSQVDLVRIATGSIDRLRGEIEKAGCTFSFKAPESIFGNWDSSRISRVITILIANAIKFGGGKTVEVQIWQEDQFAKLSVKDQGIGISREDQTKLFKRFERIAPLMHYGGLGLELYIASEIIQAHHGRISVESEPDLGSVFTIELPL